MQRELFTIDQIIAVLEQCETGAQMMSAIDNLRFNGYIR